MTATAAPPRARAVVPATPYVGLTPFTESDAPFFFGREKERRIISANLLASRLTLLYGASGVGKSSIIRAGVQRDFRVRAEKALAAGLFPESIVVVFTGWRDDPITGLADCVAASVRDLLGDLAPSPPRDKLRLDDLLVEWTRRLDEKALQHAGMNADVDEPIRTELLVIFDQFEQYFVYHGDKDGRGTFAVEFPRVVNREDLRASFLISLREDAYTQLDRFEGRILNLFSGNLRVEHLDKNAAIAAIKKPVDKYNELLGNGDPRYIVEDDLVDDVISQVQAGSIVIAQAGGGVVEHDATENARVEQAEPEETRVETPFLQLVMSRLWEEEQRRHSHVLRASTLKELGGAEKIVRRHLDDAMTALTEDERAVAARMLHQLVTPSGARIVHNAADLAGYSDVTEEVAEPILEKLDERRILRTIDPAPGEKSRRFEIRHDVLASAVVEWSRKYDEERRRREEEVRRLEQAEEERRRQRARLSIRFGFVASALAALAVALGLLALLSYLSARDERDRSRSREQAQIAVGLVGSSDPLASIRKALAATNIHETPEAEEALRTALVDSHRRAVLRGHANTVLSVSFSPDGKSVVTASDDETARIWSTETGQTTAVLRGHTGSVSDAVFSPDGKLVVTTSADGTARVWDVRSRRTVADFRGHRGPVVSAAFSPNGRSVVTAGDDGTVRVWDARSGQSQAVLDGYKGRVNGAVFSPDGTLIASAGDDGTVRIWEARTGRAVVLGGHTGRVNGVSFSPDGRLVVTAGLDATAKVWDVRSRSRRPVETFHGHRVFVTSAAFSPDGKLVVTAGGDGTARLWDVSDGKEVAVLRGHTGFVYGASFSPDGKRVVTAGGDNTARIWSVASRSLIATLRGHGDAVYAATFSPDGTLVATASADRTARLWDATDGAVMVRSWRSARGAPDVAFSPKGPLMAIAGPGTVAQVWDTQAMTPVGPPLAHPARVTSAAFSPDGKRLVTATSVGSLRIFQATSGRLLAQSKPHCPVANGVTQCIAARSAAFSPDGKLVLTEDDDGIIRVRGSSDLGLHLAIAGSDAPTSASFDPKGKRVMVVTDEVIHLFDSGNGRLRDTLPQRLVQTSEFSPDGKQVLTQDTAGNVIVSKVKSLDSVLTLGGPDDEPPLEARGSVAFSPAGDVIATATRSGTTRLWEARSGRRLAVLPGGPRAVSKVIVSHDDRFVLTAGKGGTELYLCLACLPIQELLRLGHWSPDELAAARSG